MCFRKAETAADIADTNATTVTNQCGGVRFCLDFGEVSIEPIIRKGMADQKTEKIIN